MTKQTPISAAAQALYRSVFGAPPHLVVELDNDMVLLETSEATRSVEHCPSGLSRSTDAPRRAWRMERVSGR